MTDNEIIEAYNTYGSLRKAGRALGMNRETFRLQLNQAKSRSGIDISEYTDKLAHDKQKLQDINRIERKTWRKKARFANAFYDVERELISLLKQHNKPTTPAEPLALNNNGTGIIQLSDLHFNECVDNTFGKYNWDIASKRLRKHILQSAKLFINEGINKVVIAMTGDMFNSNRRMDEILLNATNRANALFIGYSLIKEAIHELLSFGFEVHITYISGNESRLDQDMSGINILASDNFDTMLFHMLRLNLGDNVHFYTPSNVLETVINVNGSNILLLHGHTLCGKLDTDIAKVFSKYTNIGVKLDYVLFGHLHSCLISDLYARSSSLVGNNDYSAYGLNLYGRSSQNCFTVTTEGINGHRNDLECVDEYVGYNYANNIQPYHRANIPPKEGTVTFIGA